MKKCSNQSRVANARDERIHLLEGDIDFEAQQHALWGCEIGSKRENSKRNRTGFWTVEWQSDLESDSTVP